MPGITWVWNWSPGKQLRNLLCMKRSNMLQKLPHKTKLFQDNYASDHIKNLAWPLQLNFYCNSILHRSTEMNLLICSGLIWGYKHCPVRLGNFCQNVFHIFDAKYFFRQGSCTVNSQKQLHINNKIRYVFMRKEKALIFARQYMRFGTKCTYTLGSRSAKSLK